MKKHADGPIPYSKSTGNIDPTEPLTDERVRSIGFLMPSHTDVASAVVVSTIPRESSMCVIITVRGILHTEIVLRAVLECGEDGKYYPTIVAEQIDHNTRG